ncbi:MAG: hypothetical protein ACP6IP_04315 [Candidatus Njordarchaeia archaeon]
MLDELISKLDMIEFKILMYAADNCNKVSFGDLQTLTEIDSSSLSYKLKKLEKLGLIEKLGKGSYILRYKTPLCFLANVKNANMYLGMLGLKESRSEPEPDAAINLLKQYGISIKEAHILATKRTVEDWSQTLSNYTMHLLTDEELLRIEKMEKRLEKIYTKYMHNKVMILDCTSLTKTATIAFYRIATKYYAPLIYIYEQTKELIWLQDQNTIKEKLKPKKKTKKSARAFLKTYKEP